MRTLIGLILVMLSCPALADESTPLLYSRTTIKVIRNNLTAMPWQQQTPQAAPVVDSGLFFDVEVRDAATYYNQQGWFNLSSPSENKGVMLALSAPALAPVTRSSQYAPLDILLVNAEGKIIQIVPNILLSELKDDIYPKNPVLAILFLKGGTCKDLSINPGDEIEYKMFQKPPTVLTAPNLPPTATVPATPPAYLKKNSQKQ